MKFKNRIVYILLSITSIFLLSIFLIQPFKVIQVKAAVGGTYYFDSNLSTDIYLYRSDDFYIDYDDANPRLENSTNLGIINDSDTLSRAAVYSKHEFYFCVDNNYTPISQYKVVGVLANGVGYSDYTIVNDYTIALQPINQDSVVYTFLFSESTHTYTEEEYLSYGVEQYNLGYSTGYNLGFSEGQLDTSTGVDSISQGVIPIIQAPISILGDSLDFEFFGINFKHLMSFLLTAALIVFLIKLFTKGSK